ncbi:MAG TPA: helix-turn-helix transcriptional regulator [Chitinophaga sp.]|uniref:helix-turn-helix transcriptional regulator n=1 Tax=Chitinophaga sp. TaxID=1869181 RepID=UPI002C0F0A3A|nr:helix-turn-helix transcriptional regulator [Chitinophaga sp.]HVI47743.1 helix-turn-helix transcriptional regulator [Chitinophaga sp.]
MSASQHNPLPIHDAVIPPHLRKYLVPWTEASWQQYAFGHVLFQQYRTCHFTIKHYRAQISRQVNLLYSQPRAMTALHFLLSGNNITGALPDAGRVSIAETTCNILYIPAGYHEITLQPGDYLSVHIELSEDMIHLVADGWPQLQELQQHISSTPGKAYVLESVPLDYAMQCRINSMFNTGKTAPALTLELKSRIIELLLCYQQGTQIERDRLSLPAITYRNQLVCIMESIQRQPNIHEHSLKRLAKSYYMSVNTLSAGFKNLFGHHLSDFVLQQCMQKARLLIETRTHTLNDIAFELGYSDRTNFSRAFKRFHGVLPREVQGVCRQK